MKDVVECQGTDLVELKAAELVSLEGGNPWVWVAIGVVAGQVYNGVVDGLTRPCH